MVGELQAYRRWAVETKRPRRVALTGNRRLSVSVAIGSVLSAVAGFRVEMSHRDEIWRTDAHADGGTPDYPWREHFHPGINLDGGLAVGIGVISDVEPEAGRSLDTAGLEGVSRLFLHSTAPITSDAHANRAVGAAKVAIQAALGRSGAKSIRLFLATPAHFALFLGHRLNATAPVLCHERVDTGYVPTCTL